MKIGFTASTFDLLHAGHVQMLRDAKSQCDYLMVGLQIDPSVDRKEKNKPTQTIVERYTQLKGIKYVDEIIPYDTEQSLLDLLEATKPIHLRFIGEDWANKEFTGKGLHEIYYTSREHSFSTTNLKEKVISQK